MTDTLESSVRGFLRGSEELKQLLEVEAVPIASESDEFNLETSPPGSYADTVLRAGRTEDKKRILAVVTHVDPYGDEQGCVFILRLRKRRTTDPFEDYSADHAFPILSGFTITMAQARRNTIDLTSATVSTLQQTRTEFALTIRPSHDRTLEPVELITQDIQRLKAVLAECKRLRDISTANSEPEVRTPYTWMLPYISHSKPSILSSEPQDLRHARRPLLEILSDAFAGSPGDDALDISLVREHWIRSQVETMYAAAEPITLKLRVGTFNVNGKMPSQDLSAWVRGTTVVSTSKYLPPLKQMSPFSLGEMTQNPLDEVSVPTSSLKGDEAVAPPSASDDTTVPPAIGVAQDPDLIVLGFQELDLSAGALLYSSETTREDAWFTAALAGLGEKAVEYEKLASKQLVGMLVMVIVKRTLRHNFTRIQATSIGAGIMGLMGNKGATALRLTFEPPSAQDSSDVKNLRSRAVVLTFVNAHLAAFDEMYEKRNADFHDISKRLAFDSGVPAGDGAASAQTGYEPATVPLNVYQSDALFWMGDLNYRINLSDMDVRTLLSEEAVDNLPLLLRYDQLNAAMRADKAFAHFTELSITHSPSYRFNSVALSDTLGYDLKRKPAWTDRILHIHSHAVQVQQQTYACHPEITMSDHRPVSATFELHIPRVDANKLDAFVHELWKEVSHIEETDDIPRVAVEPTVIDLGKIEYGQEVQQSVLVRNTGRVPLVFRFVPLSPGGAIIPDWLHVVPKAGLVCPGSHEELKLSVTVDARLASELNLREKLLDATLVLHTSLGKDSFVVVTADYQRTCFATSITRLVRMPSPVGTLGAEELVPEDQAATAPKEVMRLVSWLMSYGSEVDELFLASGDPVKVDEIRRALDVGEDLPEPIDEARATMALNVASCLLQLLEALPEPLVPAHLHHECAESSDRETAFELLNRFPGACVNVWISLTSLLHFICQQGTQSTDHEKARKLAATFAPILLRDPPSPAKLVSPVGKRRFMLYFIS